MDEIIIQKLAENDFLHKPTNAAEFYLSRFYIKTNAVKFKIIELGGAERPEYDWQKVGVQIGNATPVFYGTRDALIQRLIAIRYTGIFEFIGAANVLALISGDVGNTITVGTDGLLFSAAGGGSGSTITPYYNEFTFASNPITIPLNLAIMSCYIEQGSHIYPSQRSIAGTNLTLTSADLSVGAKVTIEGFTIN